VQRNEGDMSDFQDRIFQTESASHWFLNRLLVAGGAAITLVTFNFVFG
jgi:hypothetical protein